MLTLIISVALCLLQSHVARGAARDTVVLVPYSAVYPYDRPFDTICPNGTFLINLVNRDTTDHNLYLSYGDRTHKKVYPIENGLDVPLCSRPTFAYATNRTIALVSECINSRAIQFLLYDNWGTATYTPLFIGVADSVLLLYDYDANRYLLTDLDCRRKQEVSFSHPFACVEVWNCIDTIYCEHKTVFVRYKTIEKGAERKITQRFVIKPY